MAQTTDKVIYSEMSVDEELTGFSSGKKMKTHRPPKRYVTLAKRQRNTQCICICFYRVDHRGRVPL